jgi:hypothetical protein
MRRRDGRVRRNVVIGVTQIVRQEEHPPREEHDEDDRREQVLDRRVGRERDGVLARLDRHPGRIVLADHMERPDVQHDDADRS